MRARDYSGIALVLTAFGTVALIGYLCGIATIEKYGTQSWLEKWQTLVAGALAIIAAMITVAAMMWQESQQQGRHADFMRLSLRADRLRARRAALPYAELLEGMANDITANAAYFTEAEKEEEDVRGAARRVRQAIKAIGITFKVRDIEEAKPLFGSAMAFGHASLTRTLHQKEMEVRNWCQAISDPTKDPQTVLRAVRPQLMAAMVEISSSTLLFARYLTTLAGHYGPD